MNFYSNYKSPLGYQTGEGQIDTYGVDHSGFSTRDELEYQFARQNKENQLIQNYNNQGITKNYPQYGTNFWGNSDNNYGFGSSNIHDNIENMNNNPFENTVNTFGQNQTENDDYKVADFVNNALGNLPLSFGAQLGLKLGRAINDARDVYNKEGIYGIAKKYGTPSVQQAGQLAQDLHNIPISDVYKHNAVSCVGASGGLTSLAETIAGGVGKEIVDFYDKTTNPDLRKQNGGVIGILKDNWKDFKNDVQSAWKGYQSGDAQVCRDYLPNNYKHLIH